MSSLFHIHIDKIEGRTVNMRVRSIHPDSGDPPAVRNFALQMLVEVYWLLKMGYLYDLRLSKEKAAALLAQSPYLRQLEDWLVMSHGWKEPVTAAKIKEIEKMSWEERQKHPQYGKLSGWGSSGDEHYLHHRPDYAGFVRLADLMILQLDEPEDGLLVFEVLEEGMLAHIEAGMGWETAAFDYRYA